MNTRPPSRVFVVEETCCDISVAFRIGDESLRGLPGDSSPRSDCDALRPGHGQAQGARLGIGVGEPEIVRNPAAAVQLNCPVDYLVATLGAETLIMAISLWAALLPAVSLFHAALVKGGRIT